MSIFSHSVHAISGATFEPTCQEISVRFASETLPLINLCFRWIALIVDESNPAPVGNYERQ